MWGGGVPRDGLIRSGATSGHTERGALDNDSEATEEGTPYNTGRQLPPLSSVLYGIISGRRSVLSGVFNKFRR